jgi:hypothetical protein
MRPFRLTLVLFSLFALWYLVIGHRTRLGVVTDSNGSVEISDGLPMLPYVFAGSSVQVRGVGSFAEIQLEGGIGVRLSPAEQSDDARLLTSYWYEIGGGPYQTYTLERGKLAVSKKGTLRRKWTTEIVTQRARVRTYGPWFGDYDVECRKDATIVRCAAGEPGKMPARISCLGSEAQSCVTTEATPGMTYRLDDKGMTESLSARPK